MNLELRTLNKELRRMQGRRLKKSSHMAREREGATIKRAKAPPTTTSPRE